MMRYSLLLAALVLLVGCTCETPSARVDAKLEDIERIQIDYRYMGWSFFEEHYTLLPHERNEGFALHSHYESRNQIHRDTVQNIPVSSVHDFIAAAQAPRWSRRQGIHQLASHIDRKQLSMDYESEDGFRAIFPSTSACSKTELRVLASLHMKRHGVAGLLDSFYDNGITWTDDYPHVSVQIFHRDGTQLTFHSNSQKALLLPWISEKENPFDTPPLDAENWSIPVSTTLRAIVPADSQLHRRLDGMDFMTSHLRSQIAWEAEHQCAALRSKPHTASH